MPDKPPDLSDDSDVPLPSRYRLGFSRGDVEKRIGQIADADL